MNLTDKELRRFGSVINGLLEELPKLIPHKDDKLPLNNQKYTYSYIQDVNRLYVSLFCDGRDAYYFYIELDSDSDAYVMRGWSYFKGKPDNSNAFTVFVNLSDKCITWGDLDLIIDSISSKERFVNLYTALCLVSQNNTFLEWED
jgi:hypothetical protein